MKHVSKVVLVLWSLSGTAFAEPTTKEALAPLKGRYAFNWHKSPAKEKCVQLTDKHLKDFERNYECNLEEQTDTASGNATVRCTHKKGAREYLVFKTKALCDEERETQAANGEE
jgi:hypothetical protein